MPTRRSFLGLAAAALTVALAAAPAAAEPSTLRVPEDFPTIQAAVNAAASGDQIRVGPGAWCGAEVAKSVDLVGEGGATIVGCASPNLFGLLRIGFFLPSAAASGTTIRHFTFDGRGVSNANLDPLAFAVFARDADAVIVEQNDILGTIQAITNTRGNGWTVSHNQILGLSVLTCDGFCGGGDGIVFQERNSNGSLPSQRGLDNSATFNVITGAIPDGLDEFSMVGIVVIGQDGVVVKNNRISIPANPSALGTGIGIEVSDQCCGAGAVGLTCINSVIVNNDGRGSELAVVISPDAASGPGNLQGATLRGNFGVNEINATTSTVKNRSIKTLEEF